MCGSATFTIGTSRSTRRYPTHMTTSTARRLACVVPTSGHYPVRAVRMALAGVGRRSRPRRRPVTARARPARASQSHAGILDRIWLRWAVLRWRRRAVVVAAGTGPGRPEREADERRSRDRNRHARVPADREHAGEERRHGEPADRRREPDMAGGRAVW